MEINKEKFLSENIARKALKIMKENHSPIFWWYEGFNDPREAIEEILSIVSDYVDAFEQLEDQEIEKSKKVFLSDFASD